VERRGEAVEGVKWCKRGKNGKGRIWEKTVKFFVHCAVHRISLNMLRETPSFTAGGCGLSSSPAVESNSSSSLASDAERSTHAQGSSSVANAAGWLFDVDGIWPSGSTSGICTERGVAADPLRFFDCSLENADAINVIEENLKKNQKTCFFLIFKLTDAWKRWINDETLILTWSSDIIHFLKVTKPDFFLFCEQLPLSLCLEFTRFKYNLNLRILISLFYW